MHVRTYVYFILFHLQYQSNSHPTVELLKIYLETNAQFFTSFSFSTTFVVSLILITDILELIFKGFLKFEKFEKSEV